MKSLLSSQTNLKLLEHVKINIRRENVRVQIVEKPSLLLWVR